MHKSGGLTCDVTGNALMINPPEYEGGVKPDMWIAGNETSAKTRVTDLLVECGWPRDNVIDAGGIEKSRLLEPLCPLWVEYAMTHGSRSHAFKLLRHPKTA